MKKEKLDEELKSYNFKVAINPYNYAIKICGKFMYLDSSNNEYVNVGFDEPISEEINLSIETDEDLEFVKALYRGIISGMIFIIGDIPPYKKIDKETIDMLTNLKEINMFTIYNANSNTNIVKEYNKFLEKISK